MSASERIPAAGRILAIAVSPAVDRLVEVDRLVPGEIHRPRAVTVVPSGKALNAARAAAALGAPVTAVGLLRGHAGRWLEAALAGSSVEARFAWGAGETRTVTSVADAAEDRLTEFYELGDPMPAGDLDALEALVRSALAERPAVALMAGSLPPGTPADTYSRIVAMATAAEVPAAIDVGAATAATLAARPWLVKANAAEAAAALGTTVASVEDAVAAAARFGATGASVAIVTLGTAGAVARLGEGTWRVGAPPRHGPYPVGSGDAFLAGLLVGWLAGASPEDRLRLATGAAAANALVPGAGRLDPAVARAIALDVAVERLA
jgi:1-phosphofructokinase family hexose kinase